MNPLSEPLIIAIEAERIKRNLSIRAIARELGLHPQTLHRIINRQHGVGPSSLYKIISARPHWWDLINGSASPDDHPNGDQPDRS